MTTILIKKKDTAGAPAAGDLTNAAGGTEIAVNTATKRIYTKDAGGNVVELGTNASASTIDQLTVTTSTTLSYGTANQVMYLNGSKLLVGSGNMTFDGTALTVASIKDSALTSGRVTFAGASGLLTDSGGLTFDYTTASLTVGNNSVGSSRIFQNSTTGGITAYQVAGVDKFYIGGGSSYSMFSLGEYGFSTGSTDPIYFGINNTKTMVLGANGLTIGPTVGTGAAYRLLLNSFASGSTSELFIARGSGSHTGSGIEINSNNYTTTGTALIYMDMAGYGGASTDVIFAKDNTATRFKVDGAGNGTFNGSVSIQSAATGLVLSGSTQNLRLYGGTATHQYDIYGNGTSLRISDNSTGGLLNIDSSLTGVQVAGALRVGPNASSFVYDFAIANSQNSTTGIYVANSLSNSGGSQAAAIFLNCGISTQVASLYGYMKQKTNGDTVLGNELNGDRFFMNSSGAISIGGTPLTSAPFAVRASGADSRILVSQDGTSPYTSTLELAYSSGGTYGALLQYNVGPEALYIQNYGRSNSGTSQGAIIFQTKINNSSLNTALTLNGYTGNLTFNTSNAGIIFNNSSATTNSTLNDYETGTWTPNLYTQNSSAYSFSSVTAYGRYTKVGTLVTVQFYITFSGTRGGAGGDNVGVDNLPFVPKSSSNLSSQSAHMTFSYGALTNDTAVRAGQRGVLFPNNGTFLFGTTGVSDANAGYYQGNFCQWMITCTSQYVYGEATYIGNF